MTLDHHHLDPFAGDWERECDRVARLLGDLGLGSVIETGAQYGMQTMDRTLANLHKAGQVSQDEALTRAIDRENFLRLLKDS